MTGSRTVGGRERGPEAGERRVPSVLTYVAVLVAAVVCVAPAVASLVDAWFVDPPLQPLGTGALLAIPCAIAVALVRPGIDWGRVLAFGVVASAAGIGLLVTTDGYPAYGNLGESPYPILDVVFAWTFAFLLAYVLVVREGARDAWRRVRSLGGT